MKEKKKHLPMYGVGPIYVAVIIGLTVLGIVLSIWNVIPLIRYKGISVVLLIYGNILLLCLPSLYWFLEQGYEF